MSTGIPALIELHPQAIPALTMVPLLVFGALASKKITRRGACLGGLVTALTALGCGWSGPLCLTLFFGLGSSATSWKRKEKRRIGMDQAHAGRRDWNNVVANGGVAAVCACLALFFGPVWAWAAVASLAAACADTLSSELGSIYGTRFVRIVGFGTGTRGEDGVVSAEGTMIGTLGAAAIAGAAAAFPDGPPFLLITLAGCIGNLMDSLAGDLLERHGLIGNDAVNLVCTLSGALTVLVFNL